MNGLIFQYSMLIEHTSTKQGIGYFLCFSLIFIILLFFFSCSQEKLEITKATEQGANKSPAETTPSGTEQETTTQTAQKEEPAKKRVEVPSQNNPPLVEKAKLQLETINNMDVIKVVASGIDKDGDPVTFKYEWAINSELTGGGDTISGFKRGDKVSVKITPFDGKDYGNPKILTIEIRNTTPRIIEHKEIKFDGNLWTCYIKATDPDGDPLTYSLKSAPSGMTINPSTGLIKWNVPPDFKGKTSFTISVTDSHAGEALQSFILDITSEGNITVYKNVLLNPGAPPAGEAIIIPPKE